MSSRAQTADLLPAHVHGVYFWAVHSIGRNIMTTKRATFVDALVLAYQTQSTHKYPDPWPTTIDGAAGADAAVRSRLQS